MADLSRLKRDMDEAKGVVGMASAGMSKAADGLRGALIAAAGAFTVGAVVGWVRSAIDAADEANKLSQKLGIATEDLAGMSLAFQQAGVSQEAMQGGLVKLAKNIGDGSAALQRMGVDAKNADGTFRGTKDVLYDVADVFKDMPDGINKTALAVQVFGKSGAELIPLLNGGSQGLREMQDMAEQLGLVIGTETAQQAEKFNDTLELIGMKNKGIAQQVTAQLLPTLTNLASSFFEATAKGDSVQRMTDGIATAFKLLYTAGVLVAEGFSFWGKVLATFAGVALSVMQGEFKQALRIAQEGSRDVEQSWDATSAAISKAWQEGGDASVLGAATMVKAGKRVVDLSDDQAKAAAGAAKEYAGLLDSYVKLGKAGALKVAQQAAELEAGQKLTDAEKDYIKVMADVRDRKVKLVDIIKNGTVAQLQANMVAARAVAISQDEAKWMAEAAKANDDAATARRKDTDALQDQVEKQREALAVVGLNTRELAAREAAMLRDAAAAKDRLAIEAELVDWTGQTSAEYRKQAALLRERASLAEQGAVVKEAQAAAAEWKKVSDQIGQGLTDSLFRAFESGRGFFSTLWEGIKNTFKTTVLRLAIDPIQKGLSADIGGLLSGSSSGGDGTVLGWLSSLNTIKNIGSLIQGGAGAIGTATTASGLTYGTGFGTQQSAMLAAQEAGMGTASAGFSSAVTYSGYAAAIYAGVVKAQSDYEQGNNNDKAIRKQNSVFGGNFGQWSAEGALSSFLSSLGVNDKWSSILSGSTAVAKIFDLLGVKGGTPHYGSVVGVDAQGVASTMYGDSSKILDHYSEGTDALLRVLGGTSATLLNTLSTAFGGAGGFSTLLKFAADGESASIGQAFINRNGRQVGYVGNGADYAKYGKNGADAYTDFTADVAKATRAALDAIALPQWARDTLAELADSATLDDLAKAIAGINAFQSALRAVQENVAPLGGVFARVAGLSGDALKQLTDFAGGIEAFSGKVGGYVSNYYSQEEQAALQAAALQKQLQAAGIDGAGLATRGDFRALVDGLDVGTEEGRRRLVALLDASAAFAQVSDYLATAGGTLGSLAGLAPQSGVLGSLTVAETQTAQLDTQRAQLDQLTVLDDSINGTTAAVVELQAGQAAVVDWLQRIDKRFDGWDAGEGLQVVTSGP